jgi:hypothetical protein
MLLAGSAVYATMKESTPVSAETALAEFRENGGSSSGKDEKSPAASDAIVGKKHHPSKTKPKQGATASTVTASTQTSEGSGQTTVAQGTSPATPADDKKAAEKNVPDTGPPREGVYTWSVEGYEQAPGVRRDLPSRSQRVITWEDNGAWTEHHIFSEQREEWFGLVVSDQGVATTDSRNRVVMGPVTADNTVVFDPPVFVSRFPFEVGQTWSGSWSGKTSGDYTGKTFEHGYMTIGDKKVEVYATEVVMHMQGEVSGTVVTKSWVAPEYRLVVKQYQNMDVQAGANYKSEWTGTVLSLDPQT